MKKEEIAIKAQQLQSQIHILMSQKQTFQLQLSEIENALKELENLEEDYAYKLLGTVLVKRKKEELIKDLKEKKDILELRINTIDKQIEKADKELRDLVRGGKVGE